MIPDVTQERVVSRDYTLVSAADGITAPFTSQTIPVHPTVGCVTFTNLQIRFGAWFSQIESKFMRELYLTTKQSQQHAYIPHLKEGDLRTNSVKSDANLICPRVPCSTPLRNSTGGSRSSMNDFKDETALKPVHCNSLIRNSHD